MSSLKLRYSTGGKTVEHETEVVPSCPLRGEPIAALMTWISERFSSKEWAIPPPSASGIYDLWYAGNNGAWVPVRVTIAFSERRVAALTASKGHR